MSKRGAGSVIPTGWAKFSWSNLFGPWLMGAAIFIQDARGEFNPIETLEMLHNYPITVLCAPPTAYRMLVLDEPMAYLKSPLLKCYVIVWEPESRSIQK